MAFPWIEFALFTGLPTGLLVANLLLSWRLKRDAALRRVKALKEHAEMLSAELEHTLHRVKKLEARLNMREVREAKRVREAEEDLPIAGKGIGNGVTLQQMPGESTEQWKARVRLMIANRTVVADG